MEDKKDLLEMDFGTQENDSFQHGSISLAEGAIASGHPERLSLLMAILLITLINQNEMTKF